MARAETIGFCSLHLHERNEPTRKAARLAVVDDNCAECICKASSHCENFPCDSENVCGAIPKEYYDPNIGLNGYGILSCEDFFLMHVKYNNETCATLNSVGSGNTTTLADCLKKNKLTFTRIIYHPKDYDPRIGLKVYEWPNANIKYEFTIPWELDRNLDTFLLKRLPDDRMDAKISCNPSLDEILCEITSWGRYGQPNILVGNCASFSECQLKFEPLWPSVFSSGYELLSGQFEEIKSSESTPYRSFATKFSQGYLECSGTYSGEFLSKIDYFFTGLDNRKYLMSDTFPQEKIIKMSTKLEQPVRVGTSKWAQSEINIKVATDQVIPEIKSSATTPSGVNEPDQQLPKINSSDGIRPGINKIESKEEQLHPKINLTDSTRPGVNVIDSNELIYEYVKIGGAITGVIIILILLLVIYVATRRRVVIVLNLSPEEIKEFLAGTPHQNTGHNESTPVESRPFNSEYKICNRDLKTENKFLGAVVDGLSEGKCLGVTELSRYGNLNNYLQKPSTQQSVDCKNIYVQNEMELHETFPLPVLLHFCKQIAKGMDFIAQNVIHGDLATRNVLVFENHVVKITDFGFSRKVYTRSNYTKKSKVPLPWAWMALESLCFNQYSPKTDVWSFGVTMWEILSKGRTPYSGTVWTPDFADQVQAGLRLTKPAVAPDNVYNFMLTCWENKPQNRPSFTECVQFFSSLEPKLQRE
ncbi:unnamed protein product [Allacma fusca]|uniref:Protein kinase domain-containing protein n=1 Tax=Allacma fusca TaxID=39272 RepID=A0A8J2NQE4_9HEXA|nr:unnamed protein product [Allacma fusca]